MHPVGIVALVMWLVVAFGALAGLALWTESLEREIHARAYREVLIEKGMMRPGESMHRALRRAKRASGKPRRLANLLGTPPPPLSMESPPPMRPSTPLMIARASTPESPHPPPLPPLPRIQRSSR